MCFDGSADAEAAIARSGVLLEPRSAVVVTVWEPVKTWTAYDPATIISAPLERLPPRTSASTKSRRMWRATRLNAE